MESTNVIKVLEALEDEQLPNIKFVEAGACIGGCVGGPLAVENGFVAETKIKLLTKRLTSYEGKGISVYWVDDVSFSKKIEYLPVMKLDNDIIEAMKKMDRLETIYDSVAEN